MSIKAMNHEKYCPVCQGFGQVDTGIDESPVTVCNACNGTGIRQAIEQAQKQEPVSIKSAAKKAGINLPENYIPTMDEAIAAGNSVLMNEQAALLRECRAALDSLISQKPTLAGLLCGSTTLGNLKAELGAYRPQGVFGANSPQRQPLTDEQIKVMWRCSRIYGSNEEKALAMARAIEAAHGIGKGEA